MIWILIKANDEARRMRFASMNALDLKPYVPDGYRANIMKSISLVAALNNTNDIGFFLYIHNLN